MNGFEQTGELRRSQNCTAIPSGGLRRQDNMLLHVYIGVGSALGVLIIVTIIVLVVSRRKTARQHSMRKPANSTKNHSSVTGSFYPMNNYDTVYADDSSHTSIGNSSSHRNNHTPLTDLPVGLDPVEMLYSNYKVDKPSVKSKRSKSAGGPYLRETDEHLAAISCASRSTRSCFPALAETGIHSAKHPDYPYPTGTHKLDTGTVYRPRTRGMETKTTREKTVYFARMNDANDSTNSNYAITSSVLQRESCMHELPISNGELDRRVRWGDRSPTSEDAGEYYSNWTTGDHLVANSCWTEASRQKVSNRNQAKICHVTYQENDYDSLYKGTGHFHPLCGDDEYHHLYGYV